MFGFSSSLFVVGIGRFLVGFGSAFAFVGVLSLAVHWLPRRYFSLVTGLVTTLGMLGVVYGEVKVTSLASSMGLHAVLGTLVFLGAALMCIIFMVVRDGPGGAQVKAQPLGLFFKEVWRVLTSSQVWIIGVVGACLYTSLSVFGELWGKSYLEQAHHLTKIEAAQSISLMFLGWAVGAPLSGYWSDRTGRRVFPLVMGALLSLICISAVLYYPNLSMFSLNILLFLYGVFSGAEIIVFIMAKENSGALVSGTVFAAANMIVSLGGVIFQPLVGILLDTFGHSQIIGGEHVYNTADYQLALSVLPVSLVFVILVGFFLKDHKRA
jgi:MFS family permease